MFSILSMLSVFSQLTPCSLSPSNNTIVKLIIHVSDYSSKIISFGFRFRISLSRKGAIFPDEIENYFSCSHLARRDRDYHMTILVFRDENEITYCYSRVSRRDRDFKKSFLMVKREKMKLVLARIPGIVNSRWSLSCNFLVYFCHQQPPFNINFQSQLF